VDIREAGPRLNPASRAADLEEEVVCQDPAVPGDVDEPDPALPEKFGHAGETALP
jgi:hypothetical protein